MEFLAGMFVGAIVIVGFCAWVGELRITVETTEITIEDDTPGPDLVHA